MYQCFVIQPFDEGGPFDKRYLDVLAPAIEEAGLTPYRVDLDPGADIVVDEIESQIRDSKVCLADITLDKPNVWYEIGYAFAAKKNVVLISSKSREAKYPFDIQHRRIISYSSEAPSDFARLREQIAERLKAVLKKEIEVAAVSELSPLVDENGLSTHEMVALVVIMENRLTPLTVVGPYMISQDMLNAGFTEIAVSLSLEGLIRKGMIEFLTISDSDPEQAYSVTQKGINWLMQNQSKLRLKGKKKDRIEEDIPF